MARVTTTSLLTRIDAMQAQLDAYTAQLAAYSANIDAALARVNAAPSTDVPSTDVPSTDVPSTDVPSTDVPSTTRVSYSLAGRSAYDVLSAMKAKLEAKYGAYKVVLIKQRKHLVPTVDGAPHIETRVFADRIEFHPV